MYNNIVQGLKVEQEAPTKDAEPLEQAPKDFNENNQSDLQEKNLTENLRSSQNVDELHSNFQNSNSVESQKKLQVETESIEVNTDIAKTKESQQPEEEHFESTLHLSPSETNPLDDNDNHSQKQDSHNNWIRTAEDKQLSSALDNQNLSATDSNNQTLPKLQLDGIQEINSSDDIVHSISKNANETKKKSLTKKQTETEGLKDNKRASISRKNSATLLSGQTGSPSPLKRRNSSRSLKVSEEKASRNTSPVQSDATSPEQQRMTTSKADSASSEHHMSQPSIVRRSSSKSLYKPTQSSAAKEKKKQEENADNGRIFNNASHKTGNWSSKKTTQPTGNQAASHEKETSKKPNIGIARFMKPTIAASAKFSEKKSRDSSVSKNSWKL
ncbi:uncharacterized protein Gasu_23360 [Galdieria sulphuraria]|uniref:Uncharacterized protein n=1 Tax=Galdieria sulphuraria TaxID=130081 RepID=M2Y3P5_GALSU|nr:uncharacterized protein Gasu_23360 [Galdieria sulphuraria]EME30434.1 hypothetical protein Gasu_23360 [Galdieria sulphuraria]|eukprot:XP_005706954.1 hypothetical protein Gasu_23360 [Galdieria sulphuraria]